MHGDPTDQYGSKTNNGKKVSNTSAAANLLSKQAKKKAETDASITIHETMNTLSSKRLSIDGGAKKVNY